MDISDFLVRKCPPTAMYIPNFITSVEERQILAHIEKTPKPKWTQLLNRRLINYGGVPHPNGMLAEVIPEWLQSYVDKTNNLNIFDPQNANHVLVNEYLPGQGIMPHTDGPLFFPIVSTISCGGHTVLEFTRRQKDDNEAADVQGENEMACMVERQPVEPPKVLFKLLLEPRSLLIFKNQLYSDYLHSIAEVDSDVLCNRIYNYENCETSYKMGSCLKRKKRVSLTIRNVPKTSKMKLRFC